MNQRIKQGATAPIHQHNEKVLFSKEELLILSNAIKKSKTLKPGTNAMVRGYGGGASYHR